MTVPDDWAPDACTLPTAERPLRVAEFHNLFTHVTSSTRLAQTRLELMMPTAIEASARDLARREGECCSFFTFEFHTVGDDVAMHIGVPPQQAEVLDAIEARVANR
jgi:hypothetical protein